MMPLFMVKEGETFNVVRITGSDEVRQHLSEIGFHTGTAVNMVSNSRGNVIVQVKDSRIALNNDMARRVMVG